MAVTYVLKIGGSPVDTSAVDLRDLTIDSQAASTLSFTESVKHYSGSWDEGQTVELEDPSGTQRFFGEIMAKQSVAGQTDLVEYQCSDRRAISQRVQVRMRGPDETDPNDYPWRCYNAPTDDSDNALNSGASDSETVGEIIQDLFDSFDTDLLAEGAIGATPGYTVGDFAALSFVPKKLVLEGMSFDQAIDHVLALQGPTWRVYINENGRWRFYDSQSQAAATITLNDDLVSQNRISRSTRRSYTAVKIFGDKDSGNQVIPHIVGNGTDEQGNALSGVNECWDAGDEANWTRKAGAGNTDTGIITGTSGGDTVTSSGKTWDANVWAGYEVIFPTYSYDQRFTIASSTASSFTLSGSIPAGVGINDPFLLGGGGPLADVFRLFEIADATKRNVVLDSPGDVDCCPHLQVILRDSSSNVVGIQNVRIKLEGAGKFRTEIPVYTSPTNGTTAGDSSTWPDYKLVYCYRDTTSASQLSARYPTSGHSGDAAGAPWNLQRELRIVYDDFDDQQDASTFEAAATEIHKLTSRVAVTGSMPVAGIDWTWRDHRQRLNFDHLTDTTGWESISAPLTSVRFDFDAAQTQLEFSDDGSAFGQDYGSMIERVRANLAQRSAGDVLEASQDYVRCDSRQRALVDRVGEEEELEGTSHSLPANEYVWPRDDEIGVTPVTECRCDRATAPCIRDQNAAFATNQFLCLPDDQHGLILFHKEGSSRGKYCRDSHLLRYETYTNVGGSGEDGMYLPILCKNVAIGSHPDGTRSNGSRNATCVSGLRDLVVVEPMIIDANDQVGIADYVIQLHKSFMYYMQRNEEAHCCLDNRLACVDQGVWGGSVPGCWNKGIGREPCGDTILETVVFLNARIKHLEECCSGIKQGELPPINCQGREPDWDFSGCGPC